MNVAAFCSARFEANSVEELEVLSAAFKTAVNNLHRTPPAKFRRVIWGESEEDILTTIANKNNRSMLSARVIENCKLVFVFPGMGAQYPFMGQDLYEKDGAFKERLDACLEIAYEITGINYRDILYPGEGQDATVINQMQHAQLANFMFSYSLSKALMEKGVHPDEMIGYSFGEYVAAALSEVITLKDAIGLIIKRGQIIAASEKGKMIGVPLPAEKIQLLLSDGLYIAIDNGQSCVVTGNIPDVTAFESKLAAARIFWSPVNTEYPLHSRLMEGVAGSLREEFQQVELQPPAIPYIAGNTGSFITAVQACSPIYWEQQITCPVLFEKGIKELVEGSPKIFLEVGAGRDISLLLSSIIEDKSSVKIFNTVRPKNQEIDDHHYLLHRLLVLWLYGFGK
ncbi:acyltransferase domain-containing protein [Chitinophaga sp. LS1]|uniref:acyltransferase domain-containing protein n=1 Tax=Chitinophaga sp. LS1 TaxID=3051176 RepID=UPI002AAAACFC|nr:acyltransferase domain-containing protein [Chitinophaga sp. LS1]WPV66535.1 acyltransferase domain-containing protein [Chitinophaga sp. LS1]